MSNVETKNIKIEVFQSYKLLLLLLINFIKLLSQKTY